MQAQNPVWSFLPLRNLQETHGCVLQHQLLNAGGFWLSGFRVTVILHLRPAALSWGSCVGKSSGDLLSWLWDYQKTIAGVWMLLMKFWKNPFFPCVPVTVV